MRRLLLLLALGFQLMVPAWMAAQREWVLRTGEVVYLRTAPVDPRDIFRGDYVRLDYELATLPGELADAAIRNGALGEGGEVYTRLDVGGDGLARATAVTLRQPQEGLYLRGRATPHRVHKGAVAALNVRYGIEKYFVEQGSGRAMEERRGGRGGIQLPMEMRVAVGRQGMGVITGHRWSRLGIGLSAAPRVAGGDRGTERNAVMELTLQNLSPEPITLGILPQLCSFSLESTVTAPMRLRAARPECDAIAVAPDHVRHLQVGETLQFEIDLNDPRWRVPVEGVAQSIGDLPWNQQFRLVYRSPPGLRGEDGVGRLWLGELPSRAFHGRGRID